MAQEVGNGTRYVSGSNRYIGNTKPKDTISAPSNPVDMEVKAILPPSPPTSGGGGGGGGYYGGSYGGGGGYVDSTPAPPPPPPPPSEEDYLKGDAAYKAQIAALAKALQDYTADDTAQRTKYETDYGTGLKQLGWTPDDPKTADINEGAWNWEDQLTASGRANENQLNDFASRGMLQSSAYAQAQNDLQRSFNDQLGSVNKARGDFLSQRDRDLAAYKNENTGASQTARAESLARRAAQYGL